MLVTAALVAVLVAFLVQRGTSGDDGSPGDPGATSGRSDVSGCSEVADLDPDALRTGADGGAVDHGTAVLAGLGCADQVVLVPSDDPTLAAVAAPLAVATGAPLLIGDPERLAGVLAELDDPEIRQLEREGRSDAELSLAVGEELGRDRFVAAPADAPNLLAGAAELAVRTEAAVLAIDPDAPSPDLPAGAEVETIGDLAETLPGAAPADRTWEVADGAGTAWLFDPTHPVAAPIVTLAALRGEAVVPVSGGDLLARRTVERVRTSGLDGAALVPVGAFAGDPAADVDLLAQAPLLPGGTLRHFDGTRMVALYGKPGSPVLGVLGEQDLEATFERVREVATGYDADGRRVVPTLEVIVTVASAEAGDDGNYSRITPPEEFRELVDRAAEEEVQVILDLQPGRTDFLTQAQLYEELLREPHVGLALDPEWRLEPDQVHLRQIGSVDAAEVQQVVDWYAELARETGVAEKLLVLHQFRLSMLPDRDTIEAPPEVAIAVHADGQGPQSDKLSTWRVMTEGAEDRWHWGWKNFYDEDPVVAEPSYILDLDPEVVLVTYQ